MPADAKISLTKFIQLLTSNNVPVSKAMFISGKIYKEFNSTTQLQDISDVKLQALGVSDKDDRKIALNAFRKSGFRPARVSKESRDDGPSTSTAAPEPPALPPPSKLRRKHVLDVNEFLPDQPYDESLGSDHFSFNEELDVEVLKAKLTVINRAPVMTAWSMMVAEQMGFKREEALSIASVYTEMNAIAKGASLGLFSKDEMNRKADAPIDSSQPYVDLLGRRPLYKTQDDQWRGLLDGVPVSPGKPYAYITRSFHQTTPYILGSMRLLAQSYSPTELNKKGWGLYASFRPSVNEWGKRSEVRCSTILALRRVDEKESQGEGHPNTLVPIQCAADTSSDVAQASS